MVQTDSKFQNIIHMISDYGKFLRLHDHLRYFNVKRSSPLTGH